MYKERDLLIKMVVIVSVLFASLTPVASAKGGHAGHASGHASKHVAPRIFHPVYIPHSIYQHHSEDGWYEYKEPVTFCPVGFSSVVCNTFRSR
jgi:hypothetical protein